MSLMHVCHACRREVDLGVSAAAGRRDECPHCRAPLHCCLNCHAYDESMRYGCREPQAEPPADKERDRKSTRLNSSHGYISYAVFCLKKKKTSSRADDGECFI